MSRKIALHAAVILAGIATLAAAQSPDAKLIATQSGNSIVVESKGHVTYKMIVDGKAGGDITQLRLPTTGPIVAREINDIFFLGNHGEDFTLRGWTGKNKFTKECNVRLVSQKPDEIKVRVDLVTTGTFKILATDELVKTSLRKSHENYKDRTLEVRRTYTFLPDRVIVDDELRGLHSELTFKTFYFTAAFEPRAIQGPVRLVKDATTKNFTVQSSGGKQVPDGITYPAAAVNFLKNGYKVTVRTTSMSFDLAKSDFYFYEKPWQQDWFQLSGFMYRIPQPKTGKSVETRHEIVFAKASVAEMPPVITIASPTWDMRWLDEMGETPKLKIGEPIKLAASAVNSDGTPVADRDISWDVYVDPWWNTPHANLVGGSVSHTIPEVTNETDRAKSKDRRLLGIFTVTAKGKNGTEAVEPFAVLIGRK